LSRAIACYSYLKQGRECNDENILLTTLDQLARALEVDASELIESVPGKEE
jgi:DNA-binding Xre family transcriptional regulator